MKKEKFPDIPIFKGFPGIYMMLVVGLEPTRCVSTEGF